MTSRLLGGFRTSGFNVRFYVNVGNGQSVAIQLDLSPAVWTGFAR